MSRIRDATCESTQPPHMIDLLFSNITMANEALQRCRRIGEEKKEQGAEMCSCKEKLVHGRTFGHLTGRDESVFSSSLPPAVLTSFTCRTAPRQVLDSATLREVALQSLHESVLQATAITTNNNNSCCRQLPDDAVPRALAACEWVATRWQDKLRNLGCVQAAEWIQEVVTTL